VRERPNLRPKTLDLYGYLLRQHILPTFGHRSVASIREPGSGPGVTPCLNPASTPSRWPRPTGSLRPSSAPPSMTA
jgi:hypothetical protein